MRLKSLRKQRPVFETAGTIVNGSRIDLSNNEYKPLQQHTHNTLPSLNSLNHELSFFEKSPSGHTYGMNTRSVKSKPVCQKVILPSLPKAAHLSSYHAIENAYLEHGIHINLNSPVAITVGKRQTQITGNSIESNSTSNTERHTTLNDRNSSRASVLSPQLLTVPETNFNSLPTDTLPQTSAIDLESTHAHNISPVSEQIDKNYCSSVITSNENSDHVTQIPQVNMIDDKPSLAAVIGNDPDLAYMSSLLQKTNGDLCRETIRRRAGLRGASDIHRRSQPMMAIHPNHPSKQTSTINHLNSSIHPSTTTTMPPLTMLPPSRKLEKDIIRHATRIRTNHSNDSSIRQSTSSKSRTSTSSSRVSTSSININQSDQQKRTIKSSKPITLEPLRLLLLPATPSLPPLLSSRVSLPPSNNFSTIKKIDYQKNKNYIKLEPIVSIDNIEKTHNNTTSFISNEHSKSTLLSDESLPSLKTSSHIKIISDKTSQSSSFDSGCYERSSNHSGDTLSVISLATNQPLSSILSGRLTSAGTRRSNPTKKVSFNDQSLTVIVATSTYV